MKGHWYSLSGAFAESYLALQVDIIEETLPCLQRMSSLSGIHRATPFLQIKWLNAQQGRSGRADHSTAPVEKARLQNYGSCETYAGRL